MILQALTEHYEDLLALNKTTKPGWGLNKVSYGINLSDNGDIISLLPLQTEQMRGKKIQLAPRVMEVPMPFKRTSSPVAYFLCDNSGYLLGINEGKSKKAEEYFDLSKKLHLELLSNTDCSAGHAVACFFKKWDPAIASANPLILDKWDDLINGANLIFWYKDEPVSNDPEVRKIWQEYYDNKNEGHLIQCLVTGEKTYLENIHPPIKGVKGAQTTGAALVSFNAPSFWSYEHEYGENAPVGRYAAFAYTTALNNLLADWEHVQHIGDATVVCWAAGGESAYQDFGMAALYGDTITEQDVQGALSKLAVGQPIEWNNTMLDPETRFYVLGLSPNASRLSVRFFWQNSFGALARNIQKHYERLKIIKPAYEKYEDLSIWQLLQETVNKNAREKTASPQLAGDVLRAVLTNGFYPTTLIDSVTLRIRAEHEITRGRAAIIKAYYLRNKNIKVPEEVLTVGLNKDSTYVPYVLGRLFSVLEKIQKRANPDINTTIKDKYFNSASATPSLVFPILINLAQKHLQKLDIKAQSYFNIQLQEIFDKFDEITEYPKRLTMPEQGSFQIGYYHQTQYGFTKKEDK